MCLEGVYPLTHMPIHSGDSGLVGAQIGNVL